MASMMRVTCLLPVLIAVCPAVCHAEPAIDYTRDIKPLLTAHCYSCHGPLKQEGGLRLDTVAAALKGGDNGPALKRGQPDGSLLIQRIVSTDASLRMPQEQPPLKAAAIRLLRTWIDQDAVAPANEAPAADPRKHWAFQVPKPIEIPRSRRADWSRNPVDALIAQQHHEHGLIPSPPAADHVLLRRLYLDVVGVPPSRQELHQFLSDPSDAAYERAVDRLLDSPRYGERWARHWMDVWRYSDWYGRRRVPDVLNSYGQIWRWRDWIVRSLNEDKGYDRMVSEMLAGDEIAGDEQHNVVATGFIVRNFYRWNYNNWMKDLVEHTGKSFLGLTLNCCHCHDHKYDPITNEEYFRFRAFFEPIEIRHDRVPGEPDPGPYPKYSYGKSYKPITTGLVRIFDEKLDAETRIYSGGEARNVIPGLDPVTPGVPQALGGDALAVRAVELPPTAWYPGLKPFVRQETLHALQVDLDSMHKVLRKARQLVAAAQGESATKAAQLTLAVDEANVARAEWELKAFRARCAADDARYVDGRDNWQDQARKASHAQRQAACETQRVAWARAARALWTAQQAAGDAADAKQAADIANKQKALDKLQQQLTQAEKQLESDSQEYAALSRRYPQKSSGRRSALARWIASPQNPLAARVAVNHIWAWHFGRGLVTTRENFGVNGARPSHPRLLDWLARELIAGEWRMKRIHRLLLTSNTYRMASPSADSASWESIDQNTQRDRDNRFLWRFNMARMEAEVVRDSMLHLSGQLSSIIGGREISQDQGLTSTRRSLYFEHHGEGRMPFLDLFDAADPCDCYRRQTSVRPQQALALTNSPLAVQQARALARYLLDAKSAQTAAILLSEPQQIDAMIQSAFQQVLSRSPTSEELRISRVFWTEQRAVYRRAAESTAKQATSSASTGPDLDPELRAVASLVHALFSHNDFLTIR